MKELVRIPDGQQTSLLDVLQEHYTRVARRGEEASAAGGSCCGPDAASCCGDSGCGSAAGLYTPEQIADLTSEAASASAGCGNPIALAGVRPGEAVLDLGSGGGIDCFLAAKATGPEGHVTGVDMTPAMVALARKNAGALGTTNVVFKLGRIEAIPEPDATVDLVMSNCVINLAQDKDMVFAEIFRVLRPGGRMVISDIVTDGDIPEELRADPHAWASCIAGADRREIYLERVSRAGFPETEVLADAPAGMDGSLRSITVRAHKPTA